MRRLFLAAMAVVALASPAPAGDLFVHNGSIMDAGYVLDGPLAGQYIVQYVRPKPEIAHLVRPGWPERTLVLGVRDVNTGQFTGNSLRLRTGCAPLAYDVSGYIIRYKSFVLFGPAALYNRNADFRNTYRCDQAGNDWRMIDKKQSYLTFEYIGPGY